MDLGITGKRAIVCAGSKGLGRGCATALAAAGVEIVLNARHADVLEETAREIASETGGSVIPVAADISTAEGRERFFRRQERSISLSTMRVGRLRVCGAIGIATISSRRSMPICWPRSR